MANHSGQPSPDAQEFEKYPSTPSFKEFLSQRRSAINASERGLPVFSAPRGGKFLGTVKLHGANVTIVLRPNQVPRIQSRNRILSRESDSMGAYALLESVPFDKLIAKVLDARGGERRYDEILIAGEHAGGKVQKGVALALLPVHYAVFNIRIDGEWVGDMRRYRDVSLPSCNIFNVAAIGPTYEVDIPDFQGNTEAVKEYMIDKTREVGNECPVALQLSEVLLKNGNVARGVGEGIVWTLIQDAPSSHLHNFKTKIEQFRTTVSSVAKLSKPPFSRENSQAFVNYACPVGGRRMEQGLEYLVEMHGADREALDTRLTGAFIKWVVEDTIKEEGGEMVRFNAFEKEVKQMIGREAGSWYNRQCRTQR